MPPNTRATKRQASARSTEVLTNKRNTPNSASHSQTTTKAKRAHGDNIGKPPSKRAKGSVLPPKYSSQTSAKSITTLQKKRTATKSQHPRRPSLSTSPPALNHPPTGVLAVFAFGNGESGELGLGPSVTETVRPRLNPFLDPTDSSKFHVVQFACGGMHTVALTDDNQIITWGVNDKGALGRDTVWDGGLRDIEEDASDASGDLNPHESTPAQVPAESFPPGTRFAQVAAGDSCSLALTDTGLVYGWGTFRVRYFPFDTPDDSPNFLEDSKGNDRFAVDKTGAVVETQQKPTLVPGLTKVTQIACGANHALARDMAGNIWAWGCGEQNQLGRRILGRRTLESLTPSRVGVCRGKAKSIASGEYHSFAIDQKDNVWAWGLNSFGEAGYAEAAGSDSVLLPYPMKVRDLCGRNVVSLDGGAHHSVAVTAGGECLAWGRMDCGQLGIEFTPKQLSDASLIRHDERSKPRICLRPTAVPNIGEVAHACCGTDHTIFIDRDGKAYATGFGSQGQLGLGSYDDVEVARPIGGKATKGRTLIWAGAGGQFSMVAALRELANG